MRDASTSSIVLSAVWEERTLEGVEAVHVMRMGQAKRLDGRDAIGQAMSDREPLRAGRVEEGRYKPLSASNQSPRQNRAEAFPGPAARWLSAARRRLG